MLRQFLPSVVTFSESEDTEIVVADNASTDDSCAVVEREFPSVRLIRLAENFGFAEGYNRVLAQVEAELVVLLNSDVEVTEGWLQPLRTYLDAHPEVAAVQPKLLSQRDKGRFEYAGACGGFIDRYGYPFCRGRILGTVEADEGQYDEPARIFWASGAALCIRLQDYRDAGGLDGRFFAHMEEIDLCWRLRSRGRQLACVPASRVYHVGAATLKKENPRKTYLNFRNNLLMLYKNLPEEELRKVLFVRSILDWVAMVQFWLKGDSASARAVMQARRDYHSTLPQFAASRIQNIMQSVDEPIAERTHWSILLKYYLFGKKKFSEL
jgi:GT2 family glycosyltransferase